ncbi:prolyl 4-hydroxylase subunit alpha-3-like [Drosophila rhopaloa]|uniref:Prolyl 4-hydroxylase N-terminal domain-containing protein n=1 Tax=Drosophila rhopaloa TaxID=1041015 RepID=A0ABM5HI38_DRORH|nr:prolyl 4-hydroxylase subunit alpha-3-like [Drosophila rhopaloa]
MNMKSIVTSPVCSFSLIRHMKSDWTHWQLFLEADPGEDALESLHSKKKYLPTYEDLTEVCSGISSIINAYDLFPKDIARGLFSGVQLKSLMSPRDCVQMAAHSIDIQDFNMTVEWLQVAISMLGNPSLQDRFHTLFHLNATDLYFKLAEVYISQYLWLPALKTVDDALKLQPRNAKLLVMEEHLSSRILLDLSPKLHI